MQASVQPAKKKLSKMEGLCGSTKPPWSNCLEPGRPWQRLFCNDDGRARTRAQATRVRIQYTRFFIGVLISIRKSARPERAAAPEQTTDAPPGVKDVWAMAIKERDLSKAQSEGACVLREDSLIHRNRAAESAPYSRIQRSERCCSWGANRR